MMNRLLNRSSTLLLLLLYIFSFSFFFTDCFGLTFSGSAPLWLGALCLSVWISADFRRGLFLGLPLSALILYAAYRLYGEDLAAQLMDLFDKIAGAYYERFYAPGSRVYSYANYSGNHTLVLLFAAFLLASYLSTGLTSRGGRVFFSLLGTVPPFLGCILVTGSPSIPLVFGIVLFWALLAAGGGHYRVDSPQGRAVFAAALPITLLLGLILVIQRPGEYEATQKDIEASQRFNSLGSALRDWMKDSARSLLSPEATPSPSASPGPEGQAPQPDPAPVTLDLTKGYKFTDDPVLSVLADESGYVYLRTRSHGDYTGNSWREAREPEGGSSLAFAAYAAEASGSAHQMQLRPDTPQDFLYLPYYTPLSQGSDSLVPSGGEPEYSVTYYDLDPENQSLPEDYVQAELAYRGFAHDYYTRLPETSRYALAGIAQRAELSADSPNIVEDVAEYVRNTGVYDLDTEPYPSDDYAVYFLTEARRGYCLHFATAATALYRALGIPARLTEGYLFTAVPGEYTQVTQENAHAWVEVYNDGLGWVPVEITKQIVPPAPEELPPESPSPEEEPGVPTPEPSADSAAPASPGPAGLPVGMDGPEDGAGQEPGTSFVFPWKALGIAAAVLLLASLVPLRRLLLLSAAARRCRAPDRRRAAVAIWKQAVKVSAYGPQVPQEIVICAEKAAFSQHEPSKEELKKGRALLDGMTRTCYGQLKPLQKVLFKFGSCLM